MIKRFFAPLALVVTACVFALGLAVSASAVSAQGADATPADPSDSAVTAAYPAHIHSGSCAELGDVVYPLNDLTRAGADVPPDATTLPSVATPAITTEITPGATDATPASGAASDMESQVAASTTIVEVSLEELLADEHAINVHESAENIQNYIACGDLSGTATGDELSIELDELNNSGYVGEAHLLDNGDGTTTVTVGIMPLISGAGTPEASPPS